MQRTHPNPAATTTAGTGSALWLLAALTIALVFALDAATPKDVSVASLAAVPVAAWSWAHDRGYRWLLFLASSLTIADAAVGGISLVTAATACAVLAGTVAIARLARSRAREAQGAGQPDLRGQAIAEMGMHVGDRRRRAEAALQTAGLSRREREVALLSIEGMTAREIAARLGIGTRTVETHLAACYSKLGVATKRGLVERLTTSQRGQG